MSSSCCGDCPDPCERWLTDFCNYEAITLTSCGVTTAFSQARSGPMTTKELMVGNAVHPADRVFRLSRAEHDVQVEVGATIEDADGTEWVVYRTRSIDSFCVTKCWCRSISACFNLLSKVTIIAQDCETCDCDGNEAWSIVGRTKGSIVISSGSVQRVNDADSMSERITGALVKWPLKKMPSAHHRLKVGDDIYRIQSFVNNGPLLPFEITLEREHAQCAC